MKIEYHIDDFISYCVEKGLSRKTYGSYEQTLILLARYLREKQGVDKVEEVKRVVQGDTIVFDSVSRMSRNAQEGFEIYKELYGSRKQYQTDRDKCRLHFRGH